MQLNGSQREQFHIALLSAFPSRAKLAQMISFKLNQNLDEIAGDQNLSQAVSDLILWAESEEKVEELLTAARLQNKGNSKLQAFEEQFKGQIINVSSSLNQAGLSNPATDLSSSVPEVSKQGEVKATGLQNQQKNFFVSYNKADRNWAEWIAWVLEEAGYSLVIQAWDFRPGGNFVLDMQRATEGTERMIAVLSEDYLKATYTQPEWAAAFRDDPQSTDRKLIPIRVRECKPTGLLGPIVYIDLVGFSEMNARDVILEAFQERAKPKQAPAFPGSGDRVTPDKVRFPGSTHSD